jgi:2-dehydropantoate 2-reductase
VTTIEPRSPVVVVGAGAIGGMIAHGLTRAGITVHAVDPNAGHIAAMRERGLVVSRSDGSRSRSAPIEGWTPATYPHDVIPVAILATKAQHTTTAAAWLAARLPADGVVLLCQNGDSITAAAEELGRGRLLAAMVEIAADVVGDGVIQDGEAGGLHIGELDGSDTARLRSLARLLGAAVRVECSSDVRALLWAKRGMAMMLTASSLQDAPTADVIAAHPRLMARLAQEVHAVAAAEGISPISFPGYDAAAFAAGDIDGAAVADLARHIAGFRKDRSGVFRDIVVRRRPTEAAHDLAALLGDSSRHGIDVPACALLARSLFEAEAGTRAIDARSVNLDQLDEALAHALPVNAGAGAIQEKSGPRP